jgi:hypothetical protein
LVDPRVLGSCTVFRADGSPLALREAWADRGAVLVFLRHFACPTCRQHGDLLAARLPELGAVGVRAALIGLGSPEALGRYSLAMRLDGSSALLLTDPDGSAHRAAGLARTKWATFGPRAVFASLKGYALGFGSARSDDDGDIVQQGGALVIGPDDEVLFAHRSRWVGDLASATDLHLAALRLALPRSAAAV